MQCNLSMHAGHSVPLVNSSEMVGEWKWNTSPLTTDSTVCRQCDTIRTGTHWRTLVDMFEELEEHRHNFIYAPSTSLNHTTTNNNRMQSIPLWIIGTVQCSGHSVHSQYILHCWKILSPFIALGCCITCNYLALNLCASIRRAAEKERLSFLMCCSYYNSHQHNIITMIWYMSYTDWLHKAFVVVRLAKLAFLQWAQRNHMYVFK